MAAPKDNDQQTEQPVTDKGLGQCVSIFSNTGGVGATMLAINIAESMSVQQQGSVVLVDLILQRGTSPPF